VVDQNYRGGGPTVEDTTKPRLAERAEELRERTDASDLVNELVRSGARTLVQELLEAEVTEALGRTPYQRRAGVATSGYRNGYKTRHLDTAEGRLEIDLPQVRATDTPFHSMLWGGMRRRTEVLERLIVEMYVRGLSTRDIEDALADLAPGEDVLLGRSSVIAVRARPGAACTRSFAHQATSPHLRRSRYIWSLNQRRSQSHDRMGHVIGCFTLR